MTIIFSLQAHKIKTILEDTVKEVSYGQLQLDLNSNTPPRLDPDAGLNKEATQI